MKYFYIYIFLLICFIISMAFLNTYNYNTYTYKKAIESFDPKTDKIILLGDSILKNDSYVTKGKSIGEILKEKTDGNTYIYAENDSTINTMYKQISSIPIDLNTDSTTIFLSAGGNDILEKYVEASKDDVPDKYINTIFSVFKTLVKSIQTKMNQSKIVLLDIYYPDNIKYNQYKPLIEKWNHMLYAYANDPNNKIYRVIKISEVLTKPEDFTLDIEPSDKGGEKIAELIQFHL